MRARLRPDLTPVNTFRLLLDALFGSEYGILPDQTLYSEAREPYAFFRVPPEPTRKSPP